MGKVSQKILLGKVSQKILLKKVSQKLGQDLGYKLLPKVVPGFVPKVLPGFCDTFPKSIFCDTFPKSIFVLLFSKSNDFVALFLKVLSKGCIKLQRY